MGRFPCCDESGLKKGPWTPEEDEKLLQYIQKNGHGSWRTLPRLAGTDGDLKSSACAHTTSATPLQLRSDDHSAFAKIIRCMCLEVRPSQVFLMPRVPPAQFS
jgi:hypothetical protein